MKNLSMKPWADQSASKTIETMDLTGEVSMIAPTFVPKKDLKSAKEPFFSSISDVLTQLQTQQKMKQLATKCWKEGLFGLLKRGDNPCLWIHL